MAIYSGLPGGEYSCDAGTGSPQRLPSLTSRILIWVGSLGTQQSLREGKIPVHFLVILPLAQPTHAHAVSVSGPSNHKLVSKKTLLT